MNFKRSALPGSSTLIAVRKYISKRTLAGFLSLLMIVILAWTMLGYGLVGCTEAPSLAVPTSEQRFVALPGTDLPDEDLPPEPEPEPEPALPEEPVLSDPASPEDQALSDPVPGGAAPTVVAPSATYSGEYAASVNEGAEPSEPSVDYSFEDEPLNTEEYAEADENGFILTASDPLSTFSADVDTASYANLRRMINEGAVIDSIPSGAVRVEEMLNYFSYDFIAPTENEPFALNAQVAPCPWNPESRLLVFGIQAQTHNKQLQSGSNLVFLVDVSGSMNDEDKLPLLKRSFSYLTEQLTEEDTVSIVTYASGVSTILEGANGNEKELINESLDQLVASGSTYGSGGLQRAYEIAEQYAIPNGNNRIIMASDGDLNVGITSTEDLYDYVSYKRHTGTYLSVLGFGTGNYKDEKMEILADNGNGNYHYIDTDSEAEKVLGTDLLANLISIADDVKLQIEFDPTYVERYRLIGYENRQLEDADFTDDTKDAAEMGLGHQSIVAYEVVMTDAYEEAMNPVSAPDSADATEDTDSQAETDGDNTVADEAASEEVVDTAEAQSIVSENEEDDTGAQSSDTTDPINESNTTENTLNEEGVDGLEEELQGENSSEDATSTATDDPPASATGNQAEQEPIIWCKINLRYKVPGEPVSKGIQYILDSSVYTDRPNRDWVFISGVIEAGLILSQSAFTGTSSLEDALLRVKVSEQAVIYDDPYRQEFADLLDALMWQSG